MMWLRLAPIALSGAVLVGVWALWVGNQNKAAEIDRLTRNVAVIELQMEHSKEARKVADAEANRHRLKSEEYDALKESLLRGNNETPIPDWFADYLDGLFGTTNAR